MSIDFPPTAPRPVEETEPLRDSREQVVEGLGQRHEAGMNGMIMGLLDYNEEIRYLGEKVMPLMVEAGLRH